MVLHTLATVAVVMFIVLFDLPMSLSRLISAQQRGQGSQPVTNPGGLLMWWDVRLVL